MTPRRRDRFLSSLRQLEQRLASESSPIKKTRLAEYKEFAHAEPAASTGLADANSFSKCGLADANIRTDNDAAVVVNDFRFADVNATPKCGLADETDASKCGLAGANAALRCVLADVNAASNCGLADVLASSSTDANAGVTGINLTSNSGLAGANATWRCGLNAASKCGSAGVTASSNCGLAGANVPSRCGLVDVNATSKCGGLPHVDPSLRCGLAGGNAISSVELTDVDLTSTCTSKETIHVQPASSHVGAAGLKLADINPTSMNASSELARFEPGRAHVGLQWATNHLTQTDRLMHLELSKAYIELAGVESVKAYPGQGKTLHVGPYLESAGVGLTDAYCTQSSPLANIELVGPDLTYVKDVDHVLIGDLTEGENAGTALVRVKPAVAPLASREIDRLEHLGPLRAHLGSVGTDLGDYPLMLDRVARTAHVGPAFAQVESAGFGLTGRYPKPGHGLAGTSHTSCALAYAQAAGVGLEGVYLKPSETSAKVASAGPLLTLVGSSAIFQPSVDLKNAADGSKLVNNKDAPADAEAMCLKSDTTLRKVCKQDECTMNTIDDLPLNPQIAAMMCYMDDRETPSVCENEAAESRDSANVIHGSQCMRGLLARTIEDNALHGTEDIIGGQVFGDALHEGRTTNDGNKYDIVQRGDAVTSSGDGVHIVNVDYFAHGRESLDSVTLCEDEEQMYDAIFSGENEDSGSLLELSARWNPWEIGRHSGEFDSRPPAEFLSTPITNTTLDTVDRKTPESSAKSLCHDLQEQEGDGLQDLTRLCALLGLEHAWLPDVKEASPALQTNKLFSNDDSSWDFSALHHEHPGSTFYSNVAKVGGNCFQYAQALDFWLQRLSQLQTEPYCCALLLMAKASLQKNRDMSMSKGFSCKFPCIIQEWLALESVADQQELI